VPEAGPPQDARPIRSENRAILVASIARGRRWLDELIADPAANTESIAGREGCSVRKVNMTISRETEFRAQRQLGRKCLLGIIWSLQRLESERQRPPIRGYLPAARKSPQTRDCVVGPGVVPRHGDFNNLDCQTGLTGVTGAKGIFRCCQISRAMILSDRQRYECCAQQPSN
jgi:hypothetical protein